MDEKIIKERKKVVLAALLHDIGKFWERGDEKYNESKIIGGEFPKKEFAHTVPTYDDGYPKYSHALWTQAFLNKFKIGALLNLDNPGDETLANLSARHHKPGNHLEAIISLADKWSSSIDRPDEGEEDESHYKEIKDLWGDSFNKKVPLEIIFDVINKDKKGYASHSVSLQKLNVLSDKVIFNQKNLPNKAQNLKPQYETLWTDFTKEVTGLMARCDDFESFYLSLNDILRNYTWCMPSATNVIPANVSLYEHLKTTAAIASCLYDYYSDNNKEINNKSDMQSSVGEDDVLMMLCIDISGIQKFIYDIANKRAAKSLKGRSFYLNLLMQHVIDKILSHEKINLYCTNVIYASGGKAYLLLPNINRVRLALIDIEIILQNFLWKDLKGKIYICLGYLSFSYKTFISNSKWCNSIRSNDITDKEWNQIEKHSKKESLDLGDLWRIASDRASAKKNQKFKNLILEDQFDIFTPQPFDASLQKCTVTGEREKNMHDIRHQNEEGDPIWVSEMVKSQIDLGNKLKDGNFLIHFQITTGDLIFDISIENEYFEIKEKEYISNLPINYFNKATISEFNSTAFNLDSKIKNVGYRTLFYGGNKQPLNNLGQAKTFEDLAKTNNGKNTKLGILRMDVDNLGQIFINGFNEKDNIQKKSFAAYSTLSFMLEAFFCGYINQIHQSNELFRNYVQILYSGGDDLFAVGRWDAIIDFAAEVRNELEKFTARKDITISGGIAIVGSKYPISKAAELAGEAEKKAKEFNKEGKNKENSKNAINFFGETVSWNKEFDFVKDMKYKFMEHSIVTGMSLIQNIQKYKLIKDKAVKDKKVDFSYVWNSAYTLKRTIDRIGDKNQEATDFVQSLADNILHNKDFGSERYLDLIAIAARWSEYLIKDIKN